MNFEEEYIYHIYNQGNNRCNIFYNRDNYLYFLKKIKTHITPFADILAWCLMPNHFHLMVFIKKDYPDSDTMTSSHRITAPNHNVITPSHRITKKDTLNNAIAVMLRSYTRAINKQEKQSGSIFKAHTKSECVNCLKGIAPSFIRCDGISMTYSQIPELQYPNICFNYIHQNPVKAKLVSKAVDWEFSSAREYAGLRDGALINKKLANEYGLQLDQTTQ